MLSSPFKNNFLLDLFDVDECFICMYVCAPHGGQKRGSYPQALELEVAGVYSGAGN